MNGVLEAKPVQPETEEPVAVEVFVFVTEDDLHDFACRCRELLAKKTEGTCPPGHWLG